MGRWVAVGIAILISASLSACGGGGGSSSSGPPATPPDGGSAVTNHQVCEGTGQLCLGIDDLTIAAGQSTRYVVTVFNASGSRPLQGVRVVLSDSDNTELSPSSGTTDNHGQVIGMVDAVFGGQSVIRARTEGLSSDLEVFLRLNVTGAAGPTPSGTRTGVPATVTPTPVDAGQVTTIFMETSKFVVSASGGAPEEDPIIVRAIAFDDNNEPVNNVNILFDFEPKIGTLRPITSNTGTVVDPDGTVLEGVATAMITIPGGAAQPGEVTVTASSPTAQGSVTFRVVPGNADREISTILLQASDGTCGTDSGGAITMKAIVFDANNEPVDDVNVLFISDNGVGDFLPLTKVTELVANQGGVAQTTLQIEPGTPVLFDPTTGAILPYLFRARAGGIEGTAQIFIVPGREDCTGDVGGDVGEPAAILLSTGPRVIRVRGNGQSELATITAEVRDNNNNRLPNRRVRFFLDDSVSPAGATLLPSNTSGGFCTTDNGGLPGVCSDDEDCDEGETCEIDEDNRFVGLTDQAGNAQAVVRAGTDLGTVSVGAEVISDGLEAITVPCSHPADAGNRCIRAASALVTVSAGRPGRISISINTLSVFNQEGSETTTLAVFVTDEFGNTVPEGIPVSIRVVDDGSGVSDRIGVVGFPTTGREAPCDVTQFPTQNEIPVVAQPGVAITCLNYPINLAGAQVSLIATSAGISGSATVNLPGSIDDLLVAANPSSVRVTPDIPGVSLVTAVALDGNGNGVPNVELGFLTDPLIGSFGPGNTPPWISRALTDENGVATVTLEVAAGTPEGEVDVEVFGGGIPRFASRVTTVSFTASGFIPGADDPQAVLFNGASPSTIGVRGGGGAEQSLVSFTVVDTNGEGLAGVLVDFFANGVGGVSVVPNVVETDRDGVASTSVLSGTRASPIQVTAAVDVDDNGTADLVTRSQPINVVGGRPNAGRVSTVVEFLNVAGLRLAGLDDTITTFVNDRFGNPVAPGTVVNFTSNGGAVASQTVTDQSGVATASLITQSPVPPDGIVTVLATVIGEEAFLDNNGNGVRDEGEPFADVPEPFIDFDGNGMWDEGNPFEIFIDVNDNGVWDSAQGPGVYNDDALLFTQTPITFSGSTILTAEPSSFTAFDGEVVELLLSVADRNNNPLTTATIISGSTEPESSRYSLIGLGSSGSIQLPDSQTFNAPVTGLNRFPLTFSGQLDDPMQAENVTILIEVSSDAVDAGQVGSNGNRLLTISGQVVPRPTSTPTATSTFTITPTPTVTLVPTDTTTPEPTATATATVEEPTPTLTPRPAAMAFVSADPARVGVRGSGISEQSIVTFVVTDDEARPREGVAVRFSVQTLGGESVSPGEAVTDANGMVSTVLTSGRRTSSVRVRAELVEDTSIFTQSTGVNVVGAPPAADRFSMAANFVNVAGAVTLGLEDTITAFLNDRFGNAVPEGTVVSFLSNASSVVNPTVSDEDGRASATLITEGGRFPPDGIVRVMGFTRGEEPFVDANGDGIYNPGEVFQDLPEPFIDSDGNGVYDPTNPFDMLVDVNDNGVWDSAQGPGVWDSNALIFDVIPVTFSGPTVVTLEPSGFTIPDGGSQQFTLTVSDSLNNPLVSGTTIAVEVSEGLELLGIPASFQLEDGQTFGQTVNGFNLFTFTVVDAEPGAGEADTVSVTVNITSSPSSNAPGGNGSTSVQRIGTLLAAPIPTPTSTATGTNAPADTPTPTSTATATATP